MNFQKNILAGALTAVSALALAGCSGSDNPTQDKGDGGVQSRVLSARAVDGYLAGATVYVDQNENGVLDAFEPRAQTDSDGFFSHNHTTGVDYCAANAPAAYARHCLRASIAANAEVLLRVTGGYDTMTDLPFKGVLSLRSSELDSNDLRLVTPMTSMTADVSLVSTEEAIRKLSGILGPGRLLDDDHIEELVAPSVLRAQLATMIVRAYGQSAQVTSPGVFPEVGSSKAWISGYVEIGKKLGLDQAGGEPQAFAPLLSSSEQAMDIVRSMVFDAVNPGTPMPDDFRLPNEGAAEPLLQFSTDLVRTGEQLIERLQAGSLTRLQVNAAVRAQAVLSERAFSNATDPELADAAAWIVNQLAQDDGLGSDLTALGGEDVDLSVLIDPEFDFDPLSNSISASAVIPAEAARAFASLVNTAFRVSIDRADKQGAALIFISGENGARSGDLDVCVRYRDNRGDFDTGSSSDPNAAMLVNGRWSLLNDHTLMLSLDVAGGARALLLKSVGVSDFGREYRFDFGGELSKWTGTAPEGFSIGAVPADDAACKARLIEEYLSLG